MNLIQFVCIKCTSTDDGLLARLDLRNARPHKRNYRQTSRQPPGPHLAPHSWPSSRMLYTYIPPIPVPRGRSSCTVDAFYLTFAGPTRGSTHYNVESSGSSNRGPPTEVKVKSKNVDYSIFFHSFALFAFDNY